MKTKTYHVIVPVAGVNMAADEIEAGKFLVGLVKQIQQDTLESMSKNEIANSHPAELVLQYQINYESEENDG